jgi:acyl-ACP thioesterase
MVGEQVSPMMQTSKTWLETFKVCTYDIGPSGKCTPQALCRFMQEAASNHAEILNVGGEMLASRELMWVLSRLHVRLSRVPDWREHITIETWPSDRTGGVRAMRDFRIFDSRHKTIGEAGSLWILLSRKTKRPMRIPDFLRESRKPGLPDDLLNDSEVSPLNHEKYAKEFEVGITHLDFNNHVNNTCYLEWALNTLPQDIFATHELRDLLFNFVGEGHGGETIMARTEECSDIAATDRAFIHVLESKVGERPLALIRTYWNQIS